MRAKSGFTLVEILIVMVVLGILAAIVIPQFTAASTEAKESNLISSLQSVRSQIELYKIQHNDNLPGTRADVDFETAMTSKTNRYGEVGATAAHRFGPYLKSIPANPFVDVAAAYDVEEEAGTTGLGGGNSGWHFDTSTGWFQADDDRVNALDNNKPHADY